MNREERLKYFRAGIEAGYKLAVRDMRGCLKEMDHDRATEYGNEFTDILIHKPSVEEA